MREIPLTLIIPTFDRNAQLERALRSVMAQDVCPHEVIVVDDASTSAVTLADEVMRALPVRVIRREINGGPAAARNTGMREVRNDWVTFLDSDDVLCSNTLGRRWAFVEQDVAGSQSLRTIYGCGWIDCDVDDRERVIRHPRASNHVMDFAGGCWFSPGSCIIMNVANALSVVGPQDETLRRLEDFDWFLSLALAGFRFEPQPVVGARIEMKREQQPARVARAADQLWVKWEQRATSTAMRRRISAYLDLEVAGAFYYTGDRLRTASLLLRSFAYYPRLSLHTAPGWNVEPVEMRNR